MGTGIAAVKSGPRSSTAATPPPLDNVSVVGATASRDITGWADLRSRSHNHEIIPDAVARSESSLALSTAGYAGDQGPLSLPPCAGGLLFRRFRARFGCPTPVPWGGPPLSLLPPLNGVGDPPGGYPRPILDSNHDSGGISSPNRLSDMGSDLYSGQMDLSPSSVDQAIASWAVLLGRHLAFPTREKRLFRAGSFYRAARRARADYFR